MASLNPEWLRDELNGTTYSLVPETTELKVTKLVREAIISRALGPQDNLRIHKLAADLGVSVTPVANALKRLEVEGYVEIEPRKGFRVVPLSLETLEELVVLRVAVESFAVGLAAPKVSAEALASLRDLNRTLDRLAQDPQSPSDGFFRLDQEFHLALYRASGRKGLMETIVGLRNRCRAYMHLAAADRTHLAASQRQHAELLDAVERRRVARAQKVIVTHINDTLEVLQPALKAAESDSWSPLARV